MTERKIRKNNRLNDYDYSQNGAYFVTICAKDRLNLFGEIVGKGHVLANIQLEDNLQMTLMKTRKRIRLKEYDYSQNGAYFITICAYNRQSLFGNIVGQGLCSCRYTKIGKIIYDEINYLKNRYENVTIDNFVIMPNHIHMILRINNNGVDKRQEQSPCPTIGDVVCALKSITTKKSNKIYNIRGAKIWQYRYHDRIIRNEKEYAKINQYIDTNVLLWENDCFYTK